jgi:hypothetical protein
MRCALGYETPVIYSFSRASSDAVAMVAQQLDAVILDNSPIIIGRSRRYMQTPSFWGATRPVDHPRKGNKHIKLEPPNGWPEMQAPGTPRTRRITYLASHDSIMVARCTWLQTVAPSVSRSDTSAQVPKPHFSPSSLLARGRRSLMESRCSESPGNYWIPPTFGHTERINVTTQHYANVPGPMSINPCEVGRSRGLVT